MEEPSRGAEKNIEERCLSRLCRVCPLGVPVTNASGQEPLEMARNGGHRWRLPMSMAMKWQEVRKKEGGDYAEVQSETEVLGHRSLSQPGAINSVPGLGLMRKLIYG